MVSPKNRPDVSDNPDFGTLQADKSDSPVLNRVWKALEARGDDRDLPWLARQAGIPASTFYDNLKRGITKTDLAIKVADTLGVSVDWLLTGRLPASESSDPIETGADRSRRRPVERRRNDELAEVAEIDPSFGLGSVIMDDAAAPEMRTFSKAWLRQITSSPPEELYWARGRGNSMSPTIEEGEPVLIDRMQQSVRDSDLIWAFAWGEVGAIKRLRPMPNGSVRILSDNPAVPPDVAHGSEIHILGRVVAVVKNL